MDINIGDTYNLLTIIEILDRDERGNRCVRCKCRCNNIKDVKFTKLKSNHTKSCGCLQVNNSIIPKGVLNSYIANREIACVQLSNGDWMKCNRSDWDEHCDHRWNVRSGYARASYNHKSVHFHTLLMDCPEGYVRDHIDRDRLNNLRSNLRVITQRENSINIPVPSDNTTGAKGVYLNPKSGRYRARINSECGKRIGLGTYDTIEEAAEVRRKAEEKYYKIQGLLQIVERV